MRLVLVSMLVLILAKNVKKLRKKNSGIVDFRINVLNSILILNKTSGKIFSLIHSLIYLIFYISKILSRILLPLLPKPS